MPRKKNPELPRGISLYKKDPSRFVITWFDQHHKKHQEIAGDSLTKAKDLYRKRKEEARTRRKMGPLNHRRPTIAALIETYSDELFDRGERSAQLYRRNAKIITKAFGDFEADELQPGHVAKWRAKEKARGQASATVNGRLAFLKRLLNLAVRDNVLDSNPLAGERLKLDKLDNQREAVLQPEQEARLRAVVTRGFWLCIMFALHTGLRSSEMFGRTRKDLDLKNRVLVLPKTKSKERQRIKLGAVAVAVLEEILASHDSEWLFPKSLLETRVTGRHHEPVSGDLALDTFKRACEAIGATDLVFHSLRHTFITRLALLGTPLNLLQKMARHKSITMTLRYSHLQPGHEDDALARLSVTFPPAQLREELRPGFEVLEAPLEEGLKPSFVEGESQFQGKL